MTLYEIVFSVALLLLAGAGVELAMQSHRLASEIHALVQREPEPRLSLPEPAPAPPVPSPVPAPPSRPEPNPNAVHTHIPYVWHVEDIVEPKLEGYDGPTPVYKSEVVGTREYYACRLCSVGLPALTNGKVAAG